jgi:hypothetical protein
MKNPSTILNRRYTYQPYHDNGPWAKQLGHDTATVLSSVGNIVGESVGAGTKSAGGHALSIALGVIGDHLGDTIGKAAGFLSITSTR